MDEIVGACFFAFLIVTSLYFGLRGVASLRPDLLRSSFEDGPKERALFEHPSVRAMVAELERIGFHPLGVRVERNGLQVEREVSLATSAHPCYASLHRELNATHLYFLTAFDDGSVALTSSRPLYPPKWTPRFSYKNAPGVAPQELLRLHLESLKPMLDRGLRALVAPDRESRNAACRAWYANEVPRGQQRLRGLVALLSILIGIGFAAWVILHFASVSSRVAEPVDPAAVGRQN